MHRNNPELLAACSAFVAGALAVKHTFTPIHGEDDMYEALTAVLSSLNHANGNRLAAYLSRGFAGMRVGDADELTRWRGLRWTNAMPREQAPEDHDAQQEALLQMLDALEEHYDPQSCDDFRRRAAVFDVAGLHRRAVEDYDQAILADPSSAEAYAGRAIANASMAADEAATRDIEAAVARGMDLALLREQTQKLRNGVDRAEEIRGHLNAGSYDQRRGRWQHGAAEFGAVLDRDPDHAEALIGRAFCLVSLDRDEEAAEDYARAVGLDPGNALAHLGLALTHRKLGQETEAEQALARAIELGLDAGAARQVFASTSEQPPDSAEARAAEHCAEAERRLDQGRLQDALDEYYEALAEDPAFVPALMGRGRMLLTNGYPQEALEDFSAAIRVQPDAAGAYASRAVAHTMLGDDELGLRDVEEAALRGIERTQVLGVISGVLARRHARRRSNRPEKE